MKKMLSSVITLLVVLCMTVSALAESSSILIKNNDPDTEPVKNTYNAGEEFVQKINSLMTKLDDLEKHDSVVQTLTISSEDAYKSGIDVSLRMALHKDESSVKPEQQKTPSEEGYSSLYYYNLKITDAEGTLIYSYEDDKVEKAEYRDIPLGVMNSDGKNENKIFNLTISINDKLNNEEVKAYAENMDWEIVTVPHMEAEATPVQEQELPVVSAPEKTAEPEEAEPETATPEPEKKEQEEKILKKGEYLCGKDIDAGRYTMTGEGKVHVYTSEGILKSTVALKKADDESANGVAEYVINFAEGEKIVVDSEIKLTPYAAKATQNPKSTTAPTNKKTNNSSTDNSKNNQSSTTQQNSKTNPKTGDNAPIWIVSILGVLAVGAVVFIELKKRKNN